MMVAGLAGHNRETKTEEKSHVEEDDRYRSRVFHCHREQGWHAGDPSGRLHPNRVS
jgi:hypothetical protein